MKTIHRVQFGLLLAVLVISMTSSSCCHLKSEAPGKEIIFDLSRNGFVQELIYPNATPRTPQFDDYTPGSYHVDKLNLLEGLSSRRAQQGKKILAAIIAGPSLMLWEYNIILFIKDGEQVRLNCLSFPHARVTYKSTKILTLKEFNENWISLTTARFLHIGPPSAETIKDLDSPTSLEWEYDLLMVGWDAKRENVWHSTDLQLSKDVYLQDERDRFYKRIDTLVDGAIVTYASDNSEIDSIYNDLDPSWRD